LFWSAALMRTNGFPFVDRVAALRSRDEVLSRPSPVPLKPGVYAWYFKSVPAQIDATGCYSMAGRTLLYIGISPKAPPANGRPASRSNLRKRIQTHFRGNAEGSTLRKTLGCLIASETGFPLRRVGSGTRQTFTNPGEQALDLWMNENAWVAWLACDKPWEVERDILKSGISLPLNIQGNPCIALTARLRAVRRDAVAAALELPIVTDSGGTRRLIG
jgi:hypothetical protein